MRSSSAYYHHILSNADMRPYKYLVGNGMGFFLFALFSSFIVLCNSTGEDSSSNRHHSSPKKGLDIDLNEEYVPSHSSFSSSPLAEQQGGLTNPPVLQAKLSKDQEYVYRPRKAESQYSQNPAAVLTRKRMQFMRENNKEALDTYLQRERKRLAYASQSDKRLSRYHGTSMYDRRLKEARAKKREGTATKEELEFVAKKNQYFTQHRKILKDAGIKRKDDKVQIARKEAHKGTATKAQLDLLEKKKLLDKERYQRKQAEKKGTTLQKE
ncbi:uncharacterized protein FA14DRAFT_157633 [Meira miltonrushii]|uniref:Uncharacterized protein n=1 Tax=Meira miltonrushii TaxID=1280837 RepID=A0A316V677_9BASI|nr:uncharacterized protein FA14DRAFT_157633 [Meira miltonrushii]PWN32942.1 hypothetical protein FA14DRAFT_157633 [Meira miltonrushii]